MVVAGSVISRVARRRMVGREEEGREEEAVVEGVVIEEGAPPPPAGCCGLRMGMGLVIGLGEHGIWEPVMVLLRATTS